MITPVLANTAPEPGFTDPVHDAQACFRAVLDAMSHPGRINRISGVAPPAPLGVAAAAALLALVDHETPLWIDPAAREAQNWVVFHCGAPVTRTPAGSTFALALTPPDLTAFPAGTHEEPETSATIVWQVADLCTGQTFRLHGPGLKDRETLTVQGLPAGFAEAWRRNQTLFPRGVDLILCAGDRLTALPRTVSIQEI